MALDSDPARACVLALNARTAADFRLESDEITALD
jgi:hypothetical protein